MSPLKTLPLFDLDMAQFIRQKCRSAPRVYVNRLYRRVLALNQMDLFADVVRLTMLAYMRISYKLSQDELSKRLGVCRVTIYLYENTKTDNIPTDKLDKISKFFRLPKEVFTKNKGIVELPKEEYDALRFSKAGYKTLERHNPKVKTVTVDDKTTVKVGTSYAQMLSGRWVK